jgi:Domain of unknown function DUF29
MREASMGVDRSYDADLVLWAEDQARALREAAKTRVNLPIDWLNVAEEIEALGKSQSRELANRVATILLHLMKLQTSSAKDPRAGWRDTVAEQRDELERLIADAPSLRPTVPRVIANEVIRARRRVVAELAARGEAARTDLRNVTYSDEQVLGDWFPDDA